MDLRKHINLNLTFFMAVNFVQYVIFRSSLRIPKNPWKYNWVCLWGIGDNHLHHDDELSHFIFSGQKYMCCLKTPIEFYNSSGKIVSKKRILIRCRCPRLRREINLHPSFSEEIGNNIEVEDFISGIYYY